MSDNQKKFLKAYKKLCRKHQIFIDHFEQHDTSYIFCREEFKCREHFDALLKAHLDDLS